MVEPSAPIPPPPPRLCEAGPCVNYHRFEIQLDVETAKAQTIEPGGKTSGLPDKMPFHVRVHHYCYPTVGVETELGSLPVLKCNLWRPVTSDDTRDVERARNLFEISPEGQAYIAERAAWEAARAAEIEPTDDELATWIAMNLRDGDELEIAASGTVTIVVDDTARLVTKASILGDYGPNVYQFSIMRTDTERAVPGSLGARVAIQTLTLEIK